MRAAGGPSFGRGIYCACFFVITSVFLFTIFILYVPEIFGQDQQQSSSSSDQPVHIQGTVINAVTHEPISRALVFSTDNRMAAMTDGEGHFSFTLPQSTAGAGPSTTASRFSARQFENGYAGPFWLRARKPGFLEQNRGGQDGVLPGSNITISLLPEALIEGQITLSTNEPAGEISVQMFSREVQNGAKRWVPSRSGKTNSKGEFRFAELPPGDYKLATSEVADNDPTAAVARGQFYGFPPVCFPGVPDFASAATIHLTAGEIFEADIPLTRQPYYGVEIPVTAPPDSQNILVKVGMEGQKWPRYSLGYNADKRLIEGALPNGHYLVYAGMEGTKVAGGIVNITVANAPVKGPRLVMIGSGSIYVNVTEEFASLDSSQESVTWNNGTHMVHLRGARAYLQVQLEPINESVFDMGAGMRIPGNEALVIENVMPGQYWARFNSAIGYVASATMDGVDLLREPLVITSASSSPMEITMRDDGAEIHGSLADTSSGEASGTSNQAMTIRRFGFIFCIPLPGSTGQFAQFGTDRNGDFKSPMLAPGNYLVLAFNSFQPNFPYRDADAMKAYDGRGQIVHLDPGEKQQLQLKIISSDE